jgi:hypothetical protein
MGVARDSRALKACKETTRLRHANFPLALVLCAALAACGDDESGTTPPIMSRPTRSPITMGIG